ncbi:hypothetical protein MBLNU457_1576t1 [Dothideomycetes sp. NU457]
MGVDTRRPPLPAPTEDPSSMDTETDLGTEVSRRTDRTHYSIPDDGSPITVPTSKLHASREGQLTHGRHKSQTSLLIEYFEGGKTADGKTRSKPSVRVRVTPSSAKRAKGGTDAVQITGIGKDRKPSYTRRISLGNKNETTVPTEGTEVSRSSGSNISGRPPIEVEVINGSDFSTSHVSRDLRYIDNPSDISSMPPESLLDTTNNPTSPDLKTTTAPTLQRTRSRSLERNQPSTTTSANLLEAPQDRSRSLSRERITQKVMEKLAARPVESGSRRYRSREGVEYEPDTKPSKERRRRSTRTQNSDEIVSPESSQLSSSITQSGTSYRSGNSKVSINNPRLLEMVEDTVRRLILPEIEQMRGEQRTSKNTRDFEDSRRTSAADRTSYSDDLSRSISKSSSSPNFRSKPKVVLNRDANNEGEVLSRGDSERRHTRRSSRESTSTTDRTHRRSSRGTVVDDEEKRDKGGHRLRDAAAGALAGGVLTTAALKDHDSHGDMNRERRKKRTKSRTSGSRSESRAGTEEYARERDVPPMPFTGGLADSELTRDSILSAATERPLSRSSRDVSTPIREVPRGTYGDVRSSPTVTPDRTPVTAREAVSRQSNRSNAEMEEERSRDGSVQTISDKAKLAALAATGLGGAALGHHLGHETRDSTHGEYSHAANGLSPIQSVSSLRESNHDPLIPSALRPRSQNSLQTPKRNQKQSYVPSPLSSPGRAQRGKDQSPLVPSAATFDQGAHLRDSRAESESYVPGTPRGEEVDEWFQKQHEENERYRNSMAGADSTQDSLNDHRSTRYTDETYEDSTGDQSRSDREIHHVDLKPEFYHAPHGAESNVASLLDPSMMSSSVLSSHIEAAKQIGEDFQEPVDSKHVNDHSALQRENETAQEKETSPQRDYWSAVRRRAQELSEGSSSRDRLATGSPRQSDAESIGQRSAHRKSTPVAMGASALPIQGDQMPEIGHGIDADSDLTTNPSDIQGPISAKEKRTFFGEDAATHSPDRRNFSFGKGDDASIISSHHEGEGTLIGAAAGAGAALAANHLVSDKNQPKSPRSAHCPTSSVEEYSNSRGMTPDLHQAQAVQYNKSSTPANQAILGDEGYASAYARSPGVETPKGLREHDRDLTPRQLQEYEAAMSAHADTPSNAKHTRHLSADSHGLASPLYESATGKGVDRIDSKDIVALMDHLTVRDSQRSARDTEILVSLVRSAAEMRNEFEEMKRFIAEQDKMIMKNTDRDADMTVNKIISTVQRAGPTSIGSRTPRASLDEPDYPTKRGNVFKRALKGLGKSKNGQDLARIEDMLMQLLDDVEFLKDHQGVKGNQRAATLDDDRSEDLSREDSLDSYERRRAGPVSSYEQSGRAGAGLTANQAQQSPVSPQIKQVFHSGYDGRRDSINRVSTVMEGDEDEDELEPHERDILDHEFEDEDRYYDQRRQGVRFSGTPPIKISPTEDKSNQNTPEKQRKHKSAGSSIFGGLPKVSRWSKTTTSSVPEGHDSRRQSTEQRPHSEASRSGESLGQRAVQYDDYDSLQSEERLRSTQSLAREQEQEYEAPVKETSMDTRSLRSGQNCLTRTPSPLIPEAASELSRSTTDHRGASPRLMLPEDEDDFDDPKYQAHRNSALIEHPQPRQASTHRHQTHLEDQAHDYHTDLGTDSDLSQRTVESDFDPLQWGSNPALSLARTQKLVGPSPLESPTSKYVSKNKARDDGPLMPQSQDSNYTYTTSSSRNMAPPPQPKFDNKMYYTSPLGSGHLLEPIPEVRYSLETDRDVHRSPTLTPEPDAQPNRALLSTARKITGPRPMGSRGAKDMSPKMEVRRKPVGGRSLAQKV